MSSFSLAGRVAIVTGGSRGIGEAIAHRFAEAGAKVVIASRKPEGVQTVAEAISAQGGEALAVPCHMGKPEDVEGLIGATIERFGQVDILVNNAATNPYFGPMLGVEPGAWRKTFEVNLEGMWGASREVARHLIDRQAPGSIINIASILGTMAGPMQGVYAMTKAAVISMTRTLAAEWGPGGIRVNAIAPGFIKTNLSKALLDSESIHRTIVDRTPLGRVGVPDEISGGALFLASDAGAFVTGHTLVMDGGLTIA